MLVDWRICRLSLSKYAGVWLVMEVLSPLESDVVDAMLGKFNFFQAKLYDRQNDINSIRHISASDAILV